MTVSAEIREVIKKHVDEGKMTVAQIARAVNLQHG